MRDVFPDIVETAREVSGAYASPPGEHYGRFRLVHPKSGRRFCVVASDGKYWSSLGLPGEPWEHVSVSCEAMDRVPSYQELCWVRELFFGPEEWLVHFFPAQSEHVNVHPYCLHLWRLHGKEFPRPPRECV